MKFFSSFYFVWLMNTHFRLTSGPAQEFFPALILAHDGKNFDVIDIETVKDHNSLKIIMLTCPVLELHQFNDEGLKSLKIEQIHYPPLDGRVTHEICENQSYSPYILYDEEEQIYFVGYEFRFNEEQSDIIFSIVQEEENLGGYFRWNVINIHYKPNAVTTEHIVSSNQYIGDFESCETFSLGFEFVEDEYLPIAYAKENQLFFLNNFMKPKLNEEEVEMYLMQQQLTPINDFDSRGKRVATCSFLNTAPMWQTIANGSWKQVQKFIKNIAEERKDVQIEVITGTFGQLKLHESEFPYNRKGVNLNNTPVSEGFWKFVEYEKSDDGEEKRQGIVIFTFNYISGTVLHEPLCSESVCKKFGWKVENDDYRTGYTYCCRASKEVLEKLGVEIDEIFYDFNLREMGMDNRSDETS